MRLRAVRGRAVAATAAAGLICALGAGGAGGTPGARMSITPPPGTPAYERLADKTCHCKIPERYRFRVGGTTNFWVVTGGGTETWSMQGVLRRHRRRVSWAEASYWQARGTVTVAFSNVGVGYDSRCNDPDSAVFNAPAQTSKLERNGFDVQVDFRFLFERTYEVDTSSSYDPLYRPGPGVVQGTVRCGDGATFPTGAVHNSVGWVAHGRPLRVVKGSDEYTVRGGSHDGNHVKYHWKLKAIRKR